MSWQPIDVRKRPLAEPHNIELWMQDKSAGTLISEHEIEECIRGLGKTLTEDYMQMGSHCLVLIPVFKGAMFFAADLMRHIELPVSFDPVVVSSYGSGTESGKLTIKKDIGVNIEGFDVLLIEDIIDTGHTIKFLREHFEAKHPRSFRICALLDKPDRRQVDVKVEYIGFKISDCFVVGYGLDFMEFARNHRQISVLKPEFYTDSDKKKTLYSPSNL